MTDPQSADDGRTPPLLERLRRRKLAQWALAYAAVAWLLLQVLSLVAQPFAWPDLIMRAAIVLLAVGFFAVLVLAWFHGEKGQQRASGIELVMLAALCLIAGVGVAMVNRAPPDVGAAEATIADSASIAVLPFDDLSAGGDQAYFSDGITEEIRSVLARIPDLRVAARNSTFQFRDSTADVRDIGSRLGVAHVLEGSVRRDGDQVRITAQLSDARTGYELWTDSWEREVRSVFAVEDEIAQRIARALRQRIPVAGSQRAAVDPRAHDLYLRGQAAIMDGDEAALRSAISHFEAALRIEPAYADAHAAIAFCYMNLADAYMRPLDAYPNARDAAQRALDIDPSHPLARSAIAYSSTVLGGNFEHGVNALRDNVAANPNSVESLFLLSNMLCWSGNPAEGLRLIDDALRIDPLSPFLFWNREICLLFAGRHDEVIEAHRRTSAMAPGFVYIDDWAAAALRAQGRFEEALREYDHVRNPQYPLYGEAITLIRLNRREEAMAIVRRLEEDAAQRYVPRSAIALVYAHLGDIPKAAEWLRRAVAERDMLGVLYARIKHPEFAPIHDSPELMRLFGDTIR